MRSLSMLLLVFISFGFSSHVRADDLKRPDIQQLIAQLSNTDAKVRYAALASLAGPSAPPSLDALINPNIRRTQHSWSDSKRRAIIDAGAVPTLIQILQDDLYRNWEAKPSHGPDKPGWLAAEILGRLKATEAAEVLISGLASTDDDTFALSAWALGEIGDSRAVGPLYYSLGRTPQFTHIHQDRWVNEALGKLASPPIRLLWKYGNRRAVLDYDPIGNPKLEAADKFWLPEHPNYETQPTETT